MARNDKGDRPPAEERLNRASRTNDEAWSIIGQEREAVRKKTERLRKLRLEQEAEAGVTPIDKKPAPKKKAPVKKAPAKRTKAAPKAGK